MDPALLPHLRCPFCGTRLLLVDTGATVQAEGRIVSGVLGCECCAFPIVAGIPVLIADEPTRRAMHALEAGRPDDALRLLLELPADRADRFRALAADPTATCQAALELLSPDAEGAYFLYRFSDPTFLTAEAVMHALSRGDAGRAGPILDLCGGLGHVAYMLGGLGGSEAAPRLTVVADLYFWKLWIAKHFTAPGCAAVCCSAEAPLPFTRDLFSLAVLMDAFPYIWHKRLCADEMLRVSRGDGTLVLPHLHNARGENIAAGDPLSPAAYGDLFAGRQPRLFSDRRLFDGVLEGVVDLSRPRSDDEIGDEASLTLVASPRADLFACRPAPAPADVSGELIVNPLYAVEHRRGGATVLTLAFPSPGYEAEFGGCRRYLPASVTLDTDLTGRLAPAMFGRRYTELRRRRVLLDAPPRYHAGRPWDTARWTGTGATPP